METSEQSAKTPDIKDIQLVKDLIKELSGARKIMNLYPPNNPLYGRTLDNLYHSFEEFFNDNDKLTLYIENYSIQCNDENVYYNQERKDNIAMFFFKDGLRVLSFLNGLTKEEIQGFIRIMNMDFDTTAPDDDIVTLLWNENYDHIKFLVDEDFITDWAISKKYIISDELIKNAHEDGLRSEIKQNRINIQIEDADHQYLEKEILRHDNPKIHKIVLILVESLKHSKDPDYIDQIIMLIKYAISYCVAKGDFQNSCDILSFIEGSIDDKEDIHILDKIDSLINGKEFVYEIGSALDNRKVVDETPFKSFAEHFNHSAIPFFIELLGEMQHIKGRRLIIDALSIIGQHDINILADGLNDNRWYVVRNTALVLGKIDDPECTKRLARVLNHKDNRVRKEAVRAIGNVKNNTILHLMKKALDDSDEHVRISAAKVLGTIKTSGAKKVLFDKLQDENTSSKKFDEKRELFGAIANWNDKNVIDFLLDMLNKTSIWKKTKVNEGRACAAYALGIMRAGDSIEYLEQAAKSTNKQLQKYASDALNKIKN